MKKFNVRLWYFKDVGINEIIESHIEMVTKPKEEVVRWEKTIGKSAKPVFEVVKGGKPAPRKLILYTKYQFLIHTIIWKCMYSRENLIRLNGKIMKSVLGDCVFDMLHNLHEMKIIYLSNVYLIGKESRTIRLLDFNVTHTDICNKKICEYKEKMIIAFNEFYKGYLYSNVHASNDMSIKSLKDCQEFVYDINASLYDNEFINNYNSALSLLTFPYRKEALDYVSKITFQSEHQRLFYYSRIHNFKPNEERIISIDENNRIYHYLTNLPRQLRNFLNLKFDADIANSHPLLYSSFLINRYNLDNGLLQALYEIEIDTIRNKNYPFLNNIADIDDKNSLYRTLFNQLHYESKQLRKGLKNKGININRCKIPYDVLSYIYRTMKGTFWTDFQVLFNESDRGAIKAILFQEVLYSKKKNITNKRKYGKVFVKMFPNVWKVLRYEKINNPVMLPCRMMRLESRLFHDILVRCYQRGWKVFNLHDAVIVLDVPENEHCTQDAVKNIILAVYHDNGLFPTVKADMFSPYNVMAAS